MADSGSGAVTKDTEAGPPRAPGAMPSPRRRRRPSGVGRHRQCFPSVTGIRSGPVAWDLLDVLHTRMHAHIQGTPMSHEPRTLSEIRQALRTGTITVRALMARTLAARPARAP